MNISLQKVVVFCLMLCILSTQGMLNFFVLNLAGNGGLKSLLPPISIALLFCFVLLFKNKSFRLKVFDIILIAYIVILLLISVFSGLQISTIFYTFRELLLLFIFDIIGRKYGHFTISGTIDKQTFICLNIVEFGSSFLYIYCRLRGIHENADWSFLLA